MTSEGLGEMFEGDTSGTGKKVCVVVGRLAESATRHKAKREAQRRRKRRGREEKRKKGGEE